MALAAYLCFALALATLMCVRGYQKGSLNASGAALAFVVGLISCTASVRFGLTLITFFVASSKATRIGAARKHKLEDGHQEGGNRNWVQVAANGGLGTALAACFLWSTRQQGAAPEQPLCFGTQPWHTLLQAAYMCHYACCNADTWASELGVLSRHRPRLVTSGASVPPGTNGGVSIVGTGASIAGGLLIGLVFWVLGAALQPAAAAAASPLPPQWPLVPLGAAAGFLGSMADSLLGATLQFSGWSERKGMVVERPGEGVRHISGWDVLDNHQVNLPSGGVRVSNTLPPAPAPTPPPNSCPYPSPLSALTSD